MAKRLLHARLDAVEHWIFRETDLDAVVRGWRVSRPQPFTRSYRDPRWDREGLSPTRAARP